MYVIIDKIKLNVYNIIHYNNKMREAFFKYVLAQKKDERTSSILEVKTAFYMDLLFNLKLKPEPSFIVKKNNETET